MITFVIKARTHTGQFEYDAIFPCSVDAHLDALERFGLCHITVKPA